MFTETTVNQPHLADSSDETARPPSSPRYAREGIVRTSDESLSPSLRPWTAGDVPAFEMKFVLDEATAREVEGRIAWQLSPDPHSDPALGNAYRISTIYCDTPAFEVYRRLGRHRHRKYRLRRYGNESVIFLERKTKRGERVRKRRVTVDVGELRLLSASSVDADWSGRWFHQQLLEQRLEPVCAVHYLRTAYAGAESGSPLRLTFDRQLRTSLVKTWEPPCLPGGNSVLEQCVICEFKFRGALPALFKDVIRDLTLNPGGVSKYRNCFLSAGGYLSEGLQDA